MMHVAIYNYQETGNSKSSAEIMAPWQMHRQDAESSRLNICNCDVIHHVAVTESSDIWFMCLSPSTVLNVLHFQLL